MISSLLGREAELKIADAVLFGRTNGVVFAGPHGSGKSALLEAIAARAKEIGVAVVRIHGTPALSDVPFGAAAHLLSDETTEQRQRTIRVTERRLSASGGSAGTVLIVDDGQDLDTATLGLLHAVAVGRRVRLVVAIADGTSVPISLTRLWKDVHLDRQELAPLTREQGRAMIEARLGGPVADDAERSVWELTQGLPSFISMICDSGRFERIADLWRLDGDPTDAPQLRAAVSGLLAGVSSRALTTLAALSSVSELEVDLLDSVAGAEATSELERRGLVLRRDGRLSASPPICARVARHDTTTHEQRRIAAALADAMWQRTELDGIDLIRAVSWTLDANQHCDPVVMTRAARQALAIGDFSDAERIGSVAMALLAPPDNWEPAFAAAQAQRQLGMGMKAEEAFALAANAPRSEDRVNVGIARAHNLAIACGRFDQALALLEGINRSVEQPGLVRRVTAERTFLGAVIGDFRAVTLTARELLDDPDIDDITAVTAANGLAFASVMLLDLDHYDQDLPRFRAGAERLEADYPLALDQCDLITAVADVAQGRVDDAVVRCITRREHGMDEAWGAGDGAWAAIEAWARSFRVEPTVDDVARRAAVGLRSLDPLGLRHVGTGIAAVVLAQRGAVDEANDMYAAVSPAVSEGDRRAGLLIEARLSAWGAACAGDTVSAAEMVCSAAHTAIEFGHLLWGVLGLHDAVRFGHADVAGDLLLGVRSDEHLMSSPLLDALCLHATAMTNADPAALLTAADGFVDIGATLLAAEAAAQAGRLFGERAQTRDSARAMARAQLIGGGALPSTPSCRAITPALTERQAQIVLSLVGGATAREVADRLSLSVRTIENHIATVYRSLDVSSRGELAAALNLGEGHVTPLE